MIEAMLRQIDRETVPCELRVQSDFNRHLYLRNGRILQANSTATAGCAARFVAGHASGFAAAVLGDAAVIPTVVRRARDRLDCLQKHWPPQPTPARGEIATGGGLYDFRTTARPYTSKDRFDRLHNLYARAARRFPGAPTIICGLEEVAVERTLVTSVGTRYYGYTPRTTLVVQLDVQLDCKPGQASDNFTLFGEAEDQLEALIEQASNALDELYEHARRDSEAIHPEAGVHDVVMTSGLTGLLAHEAIGHPCEADHVTMGSAMADALGQMVASDKITLVDQAGCGFDGMATTAAYVDDEGVPGQDRVLNEKGKLVSFLHNRSTAGMMGVTPAGNARAGSYAGEPLIRMRNTAILPGCDRLDDMIAAIDHGYLLERPGQGQADLSGQFTFGVTRGYEIRRGRIGRAIRNMTVSGNGFDVLRSVSHVGADFAWMPSGWCTKGQIVPVSMGGPSLKARLVIGGR